MNSIPTSLRVAIGFIIALWIVGLIALAIGAPGEIVVAAAALGTIGAFVEWSSHRPDAPQASRAEAATDVESTAMPGEPAPQPLTRKTR